MHHALFYLLAPSDKPDVQVLSELACALATERYRQGQTLFIAVDKEQWALDLDEQLWQQDPDSFVPHSLSDEPTAHQAPIEIGCGAPRRSRQVLLNLCAQAPAFAGRFAEVIDFVPTDDTLKQQARERYKQYRAAGFTLETQAVPAPASKETD